MCFPSWSAKVNFELTSTSVSFPFSQAGSDVRDWNRTKDGFLSQRSPLVSPTGILGLLPCWVPGLASTTALDYGWSMGEGAWLCLCSWLDEKGLEHEGSSLLECVNVAIECAGSVTLGEKRMS